MSPALSLCLPRDLFPCPAGVAQLVAHSTCNRAVRGSSPRVGSPSCARSPRSALPCNYLDVSVPAGDHDRVMGAGTALPYVGRTAQRAVVAAAFREPGRIVVLSGEAGVGKSSLVALERAAAATDVIEGSCLQIAGQALPLAALEQVFDA